MLSSGIILVTGTFPRLCYFFIAAALLSLFP